MLDEHFKVTEDYEKKKRTLSVIDKDELQKITERFLNNLSG
jgi:hypothetical protein